MHAQQFSGSKKTWNSFAQLHGGGILQSYEWGEFRNEHEWTAHRVVVVEENAILLQAQLLEKRLPLGKSFFYCPEGPVLSEEWGTSEACDALEAFTSFLRSFARERKAIFAKIDPHIQREAIPDGWLESQGYVDSPEDLQAAVVAHVDLSGSEEDILARMKQKGRYNIRYAAKKDVVVRSGTKQSDLDTFYRLLESTAKRQGITYREKSYFEGIHTHLVSAGLAHYITALVSDRPVAAILVTHFGSEAVYLYGGSSEEDRNVFGSYAVQWEGIKEARERGCAYYNMTGIAHDDNPANPWAGLRQFKLKFGHEVRLIGAYDLPVEPRAYKLFTTADRLRRVAVKAPRRILRR